MKKNLAYLLTALMLISQTQCYSVAKTAATGPLKTAIKKYKTGNYTGCLQDCEKIVKIKPSALAYYYIAISYVQAGKKDEALNAYSKVLSMTSNPTLRDFATTGKTCLEDFTKCSADASGQNSADINKMINSSYKDGLSASVREEIQKQQLNLLKQKINKGDDIDDYTLNKLNYRNDKDNSTPKKPTNDEIVAALKVLNAAGLNSQVINNSIPQIALEQENPQLNELNMLMGGNKQQSRDNNSMLNMLPFMLAQDKNSTSSYSPQVMQAMIMNSMMDNYNFNFDTDNNK